MSLGSFPPFHRLEERLIKAGVFVGNTSFAVPSSASRPTSTLALVLRLCLNNITYTASDHRRGQPVTSMLFANFNQDFTCVESSPSCVKITQMTSRCISVGTRKGYSITNCDPFGRVYTMSAPRVLL